MSYMPTTIANYFLEKASQEGRALTPMQLIKLVYIAHGWHLGYFERPLIHESVQAWKFGPVIHSLYKQLKRFGSGAVTGRLIQLMPHWMPGGAVSDETKPLLDSVWNSYKKFSGLQLSSMTHQQNTPWDIAWNAKGGHALMGATISDDDIKAHYKAKIAAAAGAQ